MSQAAGAPRHSSVAVQRSLRRSAASARMRRYTAAALMLFAVLLGSPSVWAQGQAATPEGGPQWSVGLGAGVVRKPYKDIDNETIGLPILLYENRWVSIAGPGIDLKLPSAGPVSFRLRARYEFGAGYEADDAPVFQGMEERKTGMRALD